MTRFLSVACAAALLSTIVLSVGAVDGKAEEFDMAALTCNDIETDEDATMILMWLDGYLSCSSGNTLFSDRWIEDLASKVTYQCERNPNQTLLGIVQRLR